MMWCRTHGPSTRMGRQRNHEFKVSLSYMATVQGIWDKWDLVSSKWWVPQVSFAHSFLLWPSLWPLTIPNIAGDGVCHCAIYFTTNSNSIVIDLPHCHYLSNLRQVFSDYPLDFLIIPPEDVAKINTGGVLIVWLMSLLLLPYGLKYNRC